MSRWQPELNLLFGYLFFVVYGSLVPLDFHSLPLDEAWRRFETMPFLRLGVASRADWIANGVLYFPIGFLSAWHLLRRNWWLTAAALVATALGVALAFGVEFAQVFFPARTVSLNDVMAECIGSVVGAIVAVVFPGRGSFQPAALNLAGPWVRHHVLHLYLVAYVAFCLFPYDLLISRVELQQKLASDLWGWWLAGSSQRALVTVLQLAIEVALTAPLGVLLGQRADNGRSVPRWGRAAFIGLVFGLAVEGAQLLIASGTTQGASVLTRGLGALLGLALWQRRHRWSEEGLRAALVRGCGLWFPAYLVLLAAVNGWFALEWQGLDAMSVRLRELRFLPFYYHYYTSEAHALSSLASVLLMYVPVGVLAWTFGRSAGAAAWWGGLVCLSIEVSKLSLVGLHPDTTNLWIAAAVCWVLVRAAESWSRRETSSGQESVVADVPGQSEVPIPAERSSVLSLSLLGLVLLLSGWYLVSRPEFAATTVLLLAACALVVWVRPIAALLIVPALLPALDLASWTGRFFWDEFDLVLMVCLAIGCLSLPAARRRRAVSVSNVGWVMLAVSLLLSAATGAMPWPWPDANSFVSYYSPYNALRILKGAVWVWLFVGMIRRLEARGHDARASLAWGMTLGLGYVVGFVLWERLTFVGLLDFADAYRVTGPFSAMHRGGAFIECYIAVATPFAVLCVLESRRWLVRTAGLLLLAGASYAMMVTFSRNGYAAFGIALTVLLLVRGQGSWRHGVFRGVVAVAVLAAAIPVFTGSFAQERLSHWARDLSIRQDHWRDALNMRDGGPWTASFGMGLGRFPETHYWRSSEPVRAAFYRLESEGELRYLHLGGGGGLYVEQFISVPATQPLFLTLRLRANTPSAALNLSFCEKWMLTSRQCASVEARAGDTPMKWILVKVPVDLTRLVESRGLWPRPVKLSFHTPERGTIIDVADVRLRGDSGEELLANGDFQGGLDHWFFSTDVDPPWHIHSLPVTVLFDQGWFGCVAWMLVLLTATHRGAKRAWRSGGVSAASLAALFAFLASATLNTLIDEPRFLFLLLLVAWLCNSGCTSEKRAVSVSLR